ncbi:MAG: hypothetical protein JWR04_2277, partial [Rhodoglobus sp.]|nr:hypothetical protein [Rhodoglobus sp.]
MTDSTARDQRAELLRAELPQIDASTAAL